ncbi:centromere-associated protein E, partial [Biomphalaria pfeifferi]
SNGVIAYINNGQTAVTAFKEITSQNVTSKIYDNKSIDSYLQVEWKNIKISDSGKYVCEAHVQYAEGKSEKVNEMLTITVQRPTLDDLVNVIQKLIAQADEDKENLQASKQKIENIEADLNTTNQKIQRITEEIETNKQNVKSIKVNIDTNITMLREDIFTNIHGINEDLDTCKRDIGNIRMDMDTSTSMLKEKLDINTRNIKTLEVVMDTNNMQIKKDINITIQTIKQIRVDIDTNITSLKKNIGHKYSRYPKHKSRFGY